MTCNVISDMTHYYTCDFGNYCEIRCTTDPYYCMIVSPSIAAQIVDMLNNG